MPKKNKQNKRNKKGQEEIMGFVLIVLVVIIIGVIFFAFSLRRPSPGILEHKSGEMSDLLHAMLTCKTNCSVNNIPQPLDKVIILCVNGEANKCEDGNACVIANDTFTQMLGAFLGTELSLAQRSIHGYKLVLSVDGVKEVFDDKIGLTAGKQTGSLFSVSESIPNPLGKHRSIKVRLRCYHGRTAETTEE